jgi:hypothetical protein
MALLYGAESHIGHLYSLDSQKLEFFLAKFRFYNQNLIVKAQNLTLSALDPMNTDIGRLSSEILPV